MTALTQEQLRELLHYNPETGDFTWKRSRGPKKAGSRAGHATDYWRIEIDQRPYMAHRLAWFYVHGSWPERDLDHINGDPLDNRIKNLRDVDASINLQNQVRRPKHNTTGFWGVSWSEAHHKFIAQITTNGKKMHLGYFTDAAEAQAVYLSAKKRLHSSSTIAAMIPSEA